MYGVDQTDQFHRETYDIEHKKAKSAKHEQQKLETICLLAEAINLHLHL